MDVLCLNGINALTLICAVADFPFDGVHKDVDELDSNDHMPTSFRWITVSFQVSCMNSHRIRQDDIYELNSNR